MSATAPSSAVRALAEIDRLRELGSIGAGHAATSFARLVGRTIRMSPPTVRGRGSRRIADELTAWDTGIFFAIEGGPGGLLAVMFPAKARDAMLGLLLGERVPGAEPRPLGPDEESALREVGNILASSVVSAIADTLGARVLPSLPVLALEGASAVLGTLLAARGDGDALLIETEIHDPADELRGLVVFVPAAVS